MKGIELPVNVLVIVAISVLVLLGITALYVSGIIPAGQINQFSALSQACGELKTSAEPCSADTSTIDINWDANKDGSIGSGDRLDDYCKNWKGCTADNYELPEGASGSVEELCCKAIVCGCSGLSKPTKVISVVDDTEE